MVSCEEVTLSPCTFPCMLARRCETFMDGRESLTPFSPWSAVAPAPLGHAELCLLEYSPTAVSFRLSQPLAA